MDDETFPERLIRLRTERGFSQVELARRIGISRRAMCYYEREAEGLPPSRVVVQIAEVLGVSTDALLGLEPVKPDGRTVDAKFWPKWDRLTPDDKKVIAKVADSLLEKNRLLETHE